MEVKFEDLREAFDAVGDGDMSGAVGWVDRETGEAKFHLGDYEDPELAEKVPEDLYENERYLVLPTRHELGLGLRRLALDFAREHLSDEDNDRVHDMFRRPGASRRFTDLLGDRGMLPQWYAFRDDAIDRALREWYALADAESR